MFTGLVREVGRVASKLRRWIPVRVRYSLTLRQQSGKVPKHARAQRNVVADLRRRPLVLIWLPKRLVVGKRAESLSKR